jgi:23S rRNA (uracil1939-C5)-methyltransferase
MRERELDLDSLAFGGDAVGRYQGKVVFVPFGAPGDRVKVRIASDHRSYSRGEIEELVRPGPGRREPVCDLFGACGGCQWQHLEYSVQVEHKHAVFRRAMQEARVEQIDPLIPAPCELGYRRRVRIHWESGGGSARLGYYRRGSRALLDAADCPLVVATLSKSLAICRQALQGLTQARGNLVVVVDPGRDEAHISVRLDRFDRSPRSAGRGWIETLVENLHRPPNVGGQILTSHDHDHDLAGRFGSDTIQICQPGEPGQLVGSAAAFIQANADQDRTLRGLVQRWVERARGRRVLELFAGVGNLTTCLATAASKVVAVESSRAGAALLRRNCGRTGGRVQVVESDAQKTLQRLRASRAEFELAVLNPPRSGCSEVAATLPALGVQRVLYISCDPMTLARDLRILRKQGLLASRATPIDMMPQTYHVEGVVELARAPSNL